MTIPVDAFIAWTSLILLFLLGLSRLYGWWYARYIEPYAHEVDGPDTTPIDLARRRRGPGVVERTTVRLLTFVRESIDSVKARYVQDEPEQADDPAVLPGSEPERPLGSGAFARPGTERTPPFGGEPTREPDEPEPALVIMPDQLEAVRAMIDYALGESRRGEKPSKTRRIQAGFKIGRGASPKYQQASIIYDLLFGEPEPAVKYRPLDEQARPVLKEEPYG